MRPFDCGEAVVSTVDSSQRVEGFDSRCIQSCTLNIQDDESSFSYKEAVCSFRSRYTSKNELSYLIVHTLRFESALVLPAWVRISSQQERDVGFGRFVR